MSQQPLFDDTPAQPTEALGFLIAFASKRVDPFSPEDVVNAAAKAGLMFQDQRAWGGVFQSAARDGYIKRAGLFARATSNHSVRPGWVRT